ncbi:MAG: Crp/Fnr family transcriptional regulator [Bacteroidales bacterium]|nr:Crp/Fnr family transcriptional regulator [Bacteroidales bacterium]MCK9499418.1 Crp/Fnr family transcriptional regulator [Bacteroidales bacterium]MDY0315006.1 Crp/Fnr family transcriptional regulator [Bacteroidales bacterium]NLB87334.1 Crp/Fnr family transcriptional regulator [Bacteroidales bacterium]
MTENNCNCEACDYRMLVFESLNSLEINSLCNFKQEKTYKKGDIIVSEGDKIDEFFYIKTGLVKTYHTLYDGREKIVNIATPMDYISLLSVFSETYHKYSISALDDTTVCCVNLHKIKEIIKSNGEFALSLLERISKNADKIILQNLQLNSKHLRGRIAYIIILFADKIYNKESFVLPLSRKEIAQLIDMTTENVIRIISEFKKDKIIASVNKSIKVLDRKKLEQIAKHG